MKGLLEELKEQFEDKAYRSAYAASFMNSYIAAQIKTLREQRNLTQQGLAELIGTKQTGISRLENVNYSSWKVETLVKLADAFDVRLKISFEEFGSLPIEISTFNKPSLTRAEFENDKVFHPPAAFRQTPISDGLKAWTVPPSVGSTSFQRVERVLQSPSESLPLYFTTVIDGLCSQSFLS